MSPVVVFLKPAVDFSVTAIADVGCLGNVYTDVFYEFSAKQVAVLWNAVAA